MRVQVLYTNLKWTDSLDVDYGVDFYSENIEKHGIGETSETNCLMG